MWSPHKSSHKNRVLAPDVVVQAKFREIAKTITTPGFLVFLAISRTPKKMSEPGVKMLGGFLLLLEQVK